MDNIKCAIWARVSTDDQSTENQLVALRGLAAQRGQMVTREFDLPDTSGYKDNGRYHAKLFDALDAAGRGEFTILYVWALDRLSRQGIEAMVGIVRQFRERGCKVVSLQESWTESPGEVYDLLLAVMAWTAQQESKRRSERTKAGNARWLREHPGQQLGRRKGAKDVKPRKRAA